MKAVVLALATTAALGAAAPAVTVSSAPPTTIRIKVDVPDSAGIKVKLRYVDGPDSLKGTVRELTVPAEFTVEGDGFVLVASRATGRGTVRLQAERMGDGVKGSGTGDRVRLEINGRGVRVNTLPWFIRI